MELEYEILSHSSSDLTQTDYRLLRPLWKLEGKMFAIDDESKTAVGDLTLSLPLGQCIPRYS